MIAQYLAAATLLIIGFVTIYFVLSVRGAETKYDALGWTVCAVWCFGVAWGLMQ